MKTIAYIDYPKDYRLKEKNMQWKSPVTLFIIAFGYASAHYIIGKSHPDHAALVAEILNRRLIDIATTFIKGS